MPFLQFKGKSAIESYHHVVPHHRLEFDEKLSVLAKGEKPGLNGNLIIEGDNLLALKALLPTHAGRIKCVYIDPPYNTGNEGWVYNDNLTQPQFKEWIGQTVGKEGEDACRHDKWCCMMYPRLELLKQLLHPDEGIIFVSVDDNEICNLRLIMDEVFGAENWFATLCRRAMHTVRNTSKDFNLNADFVVVYASNKAWHGARKDRYIRVPMDKAGDYPHDDHDGKEFYKLDPLHARNYYKPYEYTFKNGVVWKAPQGRYPAYSEETLEEMDEAGEIVFTGVEPKAKRYLKDVQEGRPPDAFLSPEDVGFNSNGTTLLRQILGGGAFPQPKPVELIHHLLLMVRDKNAIVLDSFAGSGTIGHAVLAMNKEDKGNRTFILVQQKHDSKEDEKNNMNICENITFQRVRRVIRGYAYPKRKGGKDIPLVKVDGLGGSFTYARVGDRLFGEYRDLGKKLPSFEELAKYIFYTETSRECDLKKVDAESGFIGATDASGGTSYYLLYTPDRKADREMSLVTLGEIAARDKSRNWVIYCEKIWLHQDQLRKFEQEHGKRIRPMVVPFQLK